MENSLHMESPNTQHGATTYLRLLWDVWPMLLAAFLVAFARGWSGVKESYLHRSKLEIVFNTIISSACMSIVAVAVTWCLPFVGISLKDPSLQLGVTVMASAVGMKFIDAFISSKLGVKRVNPRNAEHLQYIKEQLTPEQRVEHVGNCPFRDDCANCKHCPKRLGESNGENND